MYMYIRSSFINYSGLTFQIDYDFMFADDLYLDRVLLHEWKSCPLYEFV